MHAMPALSLNSQVYRRRAVQALSLAEGFLDPTAKYTMLSVASGYEALSSLKISLERDLELRVMSEEKIRSAQHLIAHDWHWAG